MSDTEPPPCGRRAQGSTETFQSVAARAFGKLHLRRGVPHSAVHQVVEDVIADFRACRDDLKQVRNLPRSGSRAWHRGVKDLIGRFAREMRVEAMLRLCFGPDIGRTRDRHVRFVEDDLILALLGIYRNLCDRRTTSKDMFLTHNLPRVLDLANIRNSRSDWTGDALAQRVKLRGGTRAADLAAVFALSRNGSLARFRPAFVILSGPCLPQTKMNWYFVVVRSDAMRIWPDLMRAPITQDQRMPMEAVELLFILPRCPAIHRGLEGHDIPFVPAYPILDPEPGNSRA